MKLNVEFYYVFAGTCSSLTCRMKANSNYYWKTCFVLWTLNNDSVVGTDHAPGKALCSTRSGLMLDKQTTYAYAAIELAIGKDKLHAQFKINTPNCPRYNNQMTKRIERLLLNR